MSNRALVLPLLLGVAVLELATMGRPVAVLVAAQVVSVLIWLRRSTWPAPHRVLPVYIAAVLVQCAHLVEEYLTGFYRALPPIFGSDPWLPSRFLAFNVAWLVVFIVSGVALVHERPLAYLVAIFLALGAGVANGAGHLALALRTGGYFPGVYTGALALAIGIALTLRLLVEERAMPLPPS